MDMRILHILPRFFGNVDTVYNLEISAGLNAGSAMKAL